MGINKIIGLKPQKKYDEVITFYQDVYDGKVLYQQPPKSKIEKINEFYRKGFVFTSIVSVILFIFVILQLSPRVSKLRG